MQKGSSKDVALTRLGSLKEAIADGQQPSLLLLQKIGQCQHPVDCWDETEEEAAEVKAEALREVAEWLCGSQASSLLSQDTLLQSQLLDIVRSNLFRVLPPSESSRQQEADPEELAGLTLGSGSASGACLDPAWPHLQLVYRLLLQLISLGHGGICDQLDGPFVGQLLALFRSEDPRERELLKQVLHSLYSRLMPLRTEIRKRMGWLLLDHVYEGQPCRGLPELLQILGDIVNGFNVPLKMEHRHFFLRYILPLHKTTGYLAYFAQLSYCVTLFLEKDPSLAKCAFETLIHYWPRGCAAKEILFMAELEELLLRIGKQEFGPICVPLFRQLAKCASSQHSRVAERAIQLWNNEQLLALMEPFSHLTLPIMFPALYAASEGHWSNSIGALVLKTLKRLMAQNAMLFDDLVLNHEQQEMETRRQHNEREERWRRLSSTISTSNSTQWEEQEHNEEEKDGERPAATCRWAEQIAHEGKENGRDHGQQQQRRRRSGRRAAGGRGSKRAAQQQQPQKQEHSLVHQQLALL